MVYPVQQEYALCSCGFDACGIDCFCNFRVVSGSNANLLVFKFL